MKEKIRNFLLPYADPKVQKKIDVESISNLYYVSILAMAFEALTIVYFLATRDHFDSSVWIRLLSPLFCVAVCLSAFVTAKLMMKHGCKSHRAVRLFMIAYSSVLLIWSIWVSCRQYGNGDQLLTFFAVEMIVVCFVSFRPMISVFFNLFVYAALYAALFRIDRAQGLNILNYAVLAFISIAGMVVRYHSKIRMAEKSVQLEMTNELLAYTSRHDGLTDLRNRKALMEDVPKMLGKHLSAFMIDINYFKEINDCFGHILGDGVLKETAQTLIKLYPESWHYRYGGDEFLVLSERNDAYNQETYKLASAVLPRETIILSIGSAAGDPKDQDELFKLIAQADACLYEVKRKTHTPEYGGHDRRRGARK